MRRRRRPRHTPNGHDIWIDKAISDELDTRALSAGTQRPDVPSVLLLHGFSDSADTWRPVMRALAARSVFSTAVDLPQFGTTQRSTGTGLTESHDAFIGRAVAALDTGSGVLLVGNSFGGWGAIRAALALPNVCGVVAISPAGFPTGGLIGRHRALRPVLAGLGAVQPAFGRTRADRPARTSAMLLGHVYARAGSTRPVSRDQIEQYRSHIRRGDLRHWLALASSMIDEVTAPNALDVARLSVPLHLIWGNSDPFVTASGAYEAQVRNPAMISVNVLDDVGHCAQIQCPEVVADSVLQLLNSSTVEGQTASG